MSSKITLPDIPRAEMFDDSGIMQIEWQNFFEDLMTRIGGYESSTNAEVTVSIENTTVNIAGNTSHFSTSYSDPETARDKKGLGDQTPSPKNYGNRIQELERKLESTPTSELALGGRIQELEKALVFGLYNERIPPPKVALNRSYTVSTQGLGVNPDVYAAGFYEAPTTDANLDQASTTIVYGTASGAVGAHAFLVAGGVGTATGGTGAVTIVVSGVSVTDGGVRTPGDSEVIVSDITGMATDEYFETDKKWVGQVTYTLTVGATGHTAYAADFNYGFCKYEDFGGKDFIVTDFEIVGFAGANDTDFNAILWWHSAVGWTYSAAAFSPGGTVLCQLTTDYSTDDQLVSGEHFAWKRDNLASLISGGTREGLVVGIVTTVNNAVEYCNVMIGVTV